MRLLSTIRLSDNQKRVLALIASAETPTLAGEKISGDPNLISARNLLMKLGVITYVNNQANITDKGQQVGTEEGILDDSGGVTDAGQKLATTTPTGQPTDQQAQGGAPGGDSMDTGADPFGPAPGQGQPGEMPPGEDDEWPPLDDENQKQPPQAESFVLLKQLLS